MRPPLPVGVLIAAVITTGCAVATTTDPLQPPDGADLVVIADDMVFRPDRIEVPAGATLELHLENVGGVIHDLVLADGWESGPVRPGEAVTLTFGPVAASMAAWCSIPGHREAGMEIAVDVVDPG